LVEQRPTRPLDLDPYRAQIPIENMEYIRHLGFSPPQGEEMQVQADGHGWIYLNVLANLAQLHFTNVTASLVQNAINEYSKKLELSPDGRKVRWRGGTQMTIRSASNSPNQFAQQEYFLQQKLMAEQGNRSSEPTDRSSNQSRRGRHKSAYSPIFRMRDHSETGTGHEFENSYQISFGQDASEEPGSNSQHLSLYKQRSTEEDAAPLIFYRNLGFYMDLSGDPSPAPDRQGRYTSMATSCRNS